MPGLRTGRARVRFGGAADGPELEVPSGPGAIVVGDPGRAPLRSPFARGDDFWNLDIAALKLSSSGFHPFFIPALKPPSGAGAFEISQSIGCGKLQRTRLLDLLAGAELHFRVGFVGLGLQFLYIRIPSLQSACNFSSQATFMVMSIFLCLSSE